MHAYVINLDRAPARMSAIAAQLEALRFPFHRVPAVDGRQFGEADLPWNAYQARTLSPGEVGCVASHRLALERFLETDAPWALILEDDVILDSRIHEATAVIANQPVFDLVKLEGIVDGQHESLGYPLVRSPLPIYLMKTVSAGAAAYCISRAGARELLRVSRRMNREADFYIRQYGVTRLTVGECRPFPVTQDRSDSYIGAARLAKRRKTLATRVGRLLVKTRYSITRRVRIFLLLRRRVFDVRPVTAEGSGQAVFSREA